MLFKLRSSLSNSFALLAGLQLFAAGIAHALPLEQVKLRGKIVVKVIDFIGRPAREEIELHQSRGRPLILKTRNPMAFTTGEQVEVTGRKLNAKQVNVTSSKEILSAASSLATSGSRSVVIVKINSSDGAVPCADSSLNSLMWSGSQSVRGLYEASSYGAVTLTSDANGDNLPDIYTVNLQTSTSGTCNYASLSSSAESALQAQGKSLSGYNHKIYILPSNLNCGFAGIASIGGDQLWVPGQYCNYPDVMAHEMGHNLGLKHARLDANADAIPDVNPSDPSDTNWGEYGDTSCIMGYAGVGYRHFNSAHKFQMGWLPRVLSVPTQGGTFNLSAIESASSPADTYSGLTMTGALHTLFISYRENADNYSTGLRSQYIGRTSVHWAAPMPGISNLITTLGDGQSYYDSKSGATITQLSHGAGGATVSVSYVCVNRAPTVSVNPTNTYTNSANLSQSMSINVTNNDSASCGISTFSLGASIASAYSANLAASSAAVAPGGTVSVGLSVQPTSSAVDGSYPINIGVSEAGHVSAQGVSTLILDRIAPLAVSNLSVTTAKRGQINVSFSGVSGETSPTYLIYRNGSLLGQTTNTSFTDSNSTAGTYTYAVKVRDLAGNLSSASSANITISSKSRR